MIKAIIENACKYPGKSVVVTGGEPSLYNLEYLTSELKKRGIQTFIETSGAYPLTGQWDWICLSPKKTRAPLPEIFIRAHELKVIVYNKHDLAWGQENAEKVNDTCKLYLQPEWSKREEVVPQIVDFVMQNPRWQTSLQTHKYMHIP